MSIDPKQIGQAGATDGQLFSWNNASGIWEPSTGFPTIDSVSDQALDAIATGDGVILVDSMTLTPGVGDYLVWFDTSCDLSANSSEAEFSIFVNAVEVTNSRRQGARAGGGTAGTVVPISLHAHITGVLAAQAVEVRAGVDAGVVSIFERTLSWMRVA